MTAPHMNQIWRLRISLFVRTCALTKGEAVIRLPSGQLRRVELHWYEAHGVGKRGMKIKKYLD